ncbi:MAG: hypothetical protein ACRCT8_06855 [Lacipirellulaceae bacterium]
MKTPVTTLAKGPAVNGAATKHLDGALASLAAKALWRASAPADLREAWKQDGAAGAWPAWSKLLAERAADCLPLAGKKATLAWGSGQSLAPWRAWLDGLEGSLKRAPSDAALEAAAWVAEAPKRAPSVRLALEAVAWGHALPRLAAGCDAKGWWGLAEVLHTLTVDAARLPVGEEPPAEQSLVEQLLAGELPLVLARVAPELRPFEELAVTSREKLSAGLLRSTDGEGLPPATLLAVWPLLVGCWTRCAKLAPAAKGSRGPWNSDAHNQFEWALRQSLRLGDRHGRPALGADGEPTAMRECLEGTLALTTDDADLAAAAVRLKGYRPARKVTADPPEASVESEWSSLAVLAAGWSHKAPRIVVAYEKQSLRFELRSGGKPLFSGEWPIDVEFAGKPLAAAGEWEQQCWYSDEDCDYLELSIDLAGGGRLERQFFLAKRDGAAMVTELLLTARGEAAPFRVISRLPLVEGIGFRAEKETRDGVLIDNGEAVAGLMPLGLAEWRLEARGGELHEDSGALVLSREAVGRNGSSPLWIDLDVPRFAKQRTWRQLTVAQALKVVSPDVATAFRVQSGKSQWLVYRSLDAPANRTFMGHNVSCEGFLGRFLKSGEVDEYFELEPDDECGENS